MTLTPILGELGAGVTGWLRAFLALESHGLFLSSSVLVTLLIGSKNCEEGSAWEGLFGFVVPQGAGHAHWPHALEENTMMKVFARGPSSHCGQEAERRKGSGTWYTQVDSSLFQLGLPPKVSRPSQHGTTTWELRLLPRSPRGHFIVKP